MNLFPLPLTPFERLMLDDARRNYPMTFILVQDFSGELDQAKFEAAVSRVLIDHPLLTACVQRRDWRSPVWIQSPAAPRMQGAATQASSAWLWESWDLTRETGLRIDIRPRQDCLRISFAFHHAASDGIGGFDFVGDLWREYALACGTARRERRARSPEALWLRDGMTNPPDKQCTTSEPTAAPAPAPAPAPPTPSSSLPLKAIASEIRRFLLSSPRPLAAVLPTRAAPTFCEPLAEAELDEETLRCLQRFAAEHDCQLNDVCAAVLFQTINAWNQPTSRIHRITIPVSLRNQLHRKMPAANCLSYAFLQRSRSECESLIPLLNGVCWEVQTARRDGWCRLFLFGLGLAQRLRFALRFVMRPSKCMSTAVLSGGGDVARRMMRDLPRQEGKICIGGLRLERQLGCPPVRPKTRVAIATIIHDGKLGLAATGCPKTFGKEGTAKFLDAFAARLRNVAQGAEQVSTPSVNAER